MKFKERNEVLAKSGNQLASGIVLRKQWGNITGIVSLSDKFDNLMIAGEGSNDLNLLLAGVGGKWT